MPFLIIVIKSVARKEMENFCKDHAPDFDAFKVRTKINNERRKWEEQYKKRIVNLGIEEFM